MVSGPGANRVTGILAGPSGSSRKWKGRGRKAVNNRIESEGTGGSRRFTPELASRRMSKEREDRLTRGHLGIPKGG